MGADGDSRLTERRHDERVERLLALAGTAGARGALVRRREHIYYLTGDEPPADTNTALIVSRDGLAEARPEARLAGVWLADDDTRPLWLHADEVVPGRTVFAELVRTKDPEEVEAIRANLADNDAAFAAVARRLDDGATDFDVMSWCFQTLSEAAGEPVSYDACIGLGAAGADADAQPVGAVAREHTTLFVDLFPRRRHYVGDSTRSFSLGDPPAWAVRAHARLEHALARAEKLIRPGTPAQEIDATCRTAATLETGDCYPHHTGHGVGLFGLEPPLLVPGSDDILRAGDVVAVEPGAYFPGIGGLRLEDVFLVTESGPERLNTAERRLLEGGRR